jgi:hypothetical protein
MQQFSVSFFIFISASPCLTILTSQTPSDTSKLQTLALIVNSNYVQDKLNHNIIKFISLVIVALFVSILNFAFSGPLCLEDITPHVIINSISTLFIFISASLVILTQKSIGKIIGTIGLCVVLFDQIESLLITINLDKTAHISEIIDKLYLFHSLFLITLSLLIIYLNSKRNSSTSNPSKTNISLSILPILTYIAINWVYIKSC